VILQRFGACPAAAQPHRGMAANQAGKRATPRVEAKRISPLQAWL